MRMHWSECEAKSTQHEVNWVPVSFAYFLFFLNFMPIHFVYGFWLWFVLVWSCLCSIFSWIRMSRIVTLCLTSIHLMHEAMGKIRNICDKMTWAKIQNEQHQQQPAKNIHILRSNIICTTISQLKTNQQQKKELIYLVQCTHILNCI